MILRYLVPTLAAGLLAAGAAAAQAGDPQTTSPAATASSSGKDMAPQAVRPEGDPTLGAQPSPQVQTLPAPQYQGEDSMAEPRPRAVMHRHRHHVRRHHHYRHHRHHRHLGRCANPVPNGAACSGVDRNQNGISDKEDRAIRAGAHP